MSEEFSYLAERLESQRKWHSGKARWNKKWFYTLEIMTLMSGALIPVINVSSIGGVEITAVQFLSALLASVVVISTGLNKLYKFQENWLNFRALSEDLERTKEFYLNRVGKYDVNDEKKRRKLLIESVEDILSGTTSRFVSTQQAKQEEGS